MAEVDPVNEWSQDIQNYQQSKTNLQFNQEWNHKVTHADIKQSEIAYNPILQKYSDSNLETQVKTHEKDNLVDTLAKNKDRALRYEQTFDILNFNDKLKGLEDQPGYPIQKSTIDKSKVGGTKTYTDYNIISNKQFKEHHYLPPDERPAQSLEDPNAVKQKKIAITGLRDYNIVSNRYLELHDEKM